MNIASVINFVRAVEPREDDDSYLIETTRKELELCRKFGFRSTVLLQYDALILPEYQALINDFSGEAELGLWFEVVEPLTRDCGIQWNGRFPWDWHNDVGFLIGYKPDDRIRLIDTAFEKFRDIFGYYPAVVGSWHIDAFSLNYMVEKYHITASCNCKDQYGTDGYTMWGGYYAGAYYPSKKNMLCPAQNEEDTIPVPVFRMLGSDPVDQYDIGIDRGVVCQSVSSMEPVYGNSGADSEWVKWYFRNTYNGKSLSHSFTQFGQENSFGWDKIGAGLEMQFEILNEYIREGKVRLLTLGEAGKEFNSKFGATAPAAVCIDEPGPVSGRKTLWYNSRKYRANLILDNGCLYIRDIHLFGKTVEEEYLSKRCPENNCAYYNLPLIDGFRFSSPEKRAGIYPYINGKRLVSDSEYKSNASGNSASASLKNLISYELTPECISIRFGTEGGELRFEYADSDIIPYVSADGNTLKLSFSYYDKKYEYSVRLDSGFFRMTENGISIFSENREVIISADI